MNCRQAREIMNLVFDGERHPLESSAREHVHGCSECRQWLAGMERVIGCMASAQDRMPRIDISAAVMARLPERHPASVERRRVLISRRALTWMCAGWAFGFVVMLILGTIALQWLGTPSAGEHVVTAYGVSHTILGSVKAFVFALKPVGLAIISAAKGYQPQAMSVVRAFILLECVLLALGLVVWRIHSRLPGSMSVLV